MSTRGFTLIEVLVAVFIFALLMVAAYGSVDALLRTRDGLTQQNDRLRALQFTVGLIERDLRQTFARPIRSGYGEREAALVGARDAVAFTRAGAANPLQQERAEIERVGYALRDEHIARISYAVLDRTPATVPNTRDLLARVRKLGFRYLDGEQWRELWPPSNLQGQGNALMKLPRAVEFSIDTEDYGVITRIVDLSEVAEASPDGSGLVPGGLRP